MDYGVNLESKYPYKSVKKSCTVPDTTVENTQVVSAKAVTKRNHLALKSAIVKYGGISAGLNADNLQHYSSGIFGKSSDDCDLNVNHDTVIIGYGGTGQSMYWIVQNSWNKTWGESGYFRVWRSGGDDSGACGIQTDVFYASF